MLLTDTLYGLSTLLEVHCYPFYVDVSSIL